jgi:hypothetical protein
MEIQIKVIGGLFIILALLHIFFPGYFNWKRELSALSLVNRQMMYVHMYFIALAVLLMGILCLTSSDELLHTAFGRRVTLGLGIFWTIRLFAQFFVYSAELWNGKKFETTIHILFSIFWCYVSAIFLLSYWVSPAG